MAEIQPNWQSLYSNQGIRLAGNPALDDLRNTYKTQQADKAKQDAAFTSQIAKLNFGGAKDADLDYLHKQYGDILNTFGQLRNTTDPEERAKASLALQQKQNGFLYDIEKSKDANKQDLALAHLPLMPNANLVDGATNKILDLTKMSTFHPDREKAVADVTNNLFAPKYDFFKESAPIAKGVTKYGEPTVISAVDPKTGAEVRSTTIPQTFNKDQFIKQYTSQVMSNPQGVKKAVEETGLTDPIAAVSKKASDLADYYESNITPKYAQKGGGETLAAKMALQANAAKLKSIYPTFGQGQPDKFQEAAIQLQNTAQKDPVAAKDLLKPIADLIPTKGLKKAIDYGVSNGNAFIVIPKKRTGLYTSIPEHTISVDITDPNFGSTLRARVAQEGANISGYNQANKGRSIPKPHVETKKIVVPNERLW